MPENAKPDNSRPPLKVRRVNLDTGRENVVVISRRSKALRPELFRGFSRVELRCNSKILLATLLITDDDTLVGPDDIGLSEPAFRRFAEPVGSLVTVTPAPPPDSLDAVRGKIQGRAFERAPRSTAIIDDLTHYRYSDMEIAAFLISSASFMTSDELLALVQRDGAGRHAIEMGQPDRRRQALHRRHSGKPHLDDRGADRRRARPHHSQDILARDHLAGRAPRTPWRCWPGSTLASTR